MRKSEEQNMAGTSHLPKTAQNDTTEMLQLKMRYILKHVLLGSCWWKEMWTTIALHASCICCLHRFSTAPAHTSHRTALNTPPRANILGCLDKSLKWSVSTAYHIEIHYPILCTKYIYINYTIYIYVYQHLRNIPSRFACLSPTHVVCSWFADMGLYVTYGGQGKK